MGHGQRGIDALVGDVEGSGHWRTFQVVSAAYKQAIAHGGTTTTVSSYQDGHLLAREARTVGHSAAMAGRAIHLQMPMSAWAAHHVLADGAFAERGQRLLHPSRIGA